MCSPKDKYNHLLPSTRSPSGLRSESRFITPISRTDSFGESLMTWGIMSTSTPFGHNLLGCFCPYIVGDIIP
jgi:hypothetical protein